ncbi:hypothetical protein NI17_000605 [Thermobifida halotolerans]|uniref:Uncharacterized protein n=1 Tax=Thermobifida halotolerans TaxID=483545 RepID=A0A399G264_9ACTN|nr:hypothetical protein [Thermobifida halotolerans]UOE19804.1 hypothetical protein NI17_000605 [Thermobifida halotolerans]
MERVEAAVVPWGADRAAHTIEVAAPESLDGVEGLRLLPVPGAVVVTGTGEDPGALTGLR